MNRLLAGSSKTEHSRKSAKQHVTSMIGSVHDAPLVNIISQNSGIDNVVGPAIYENGVKHWDALKTESDSITSRREEFAKHLRTCGGPTTPAEIGVDKNDLFDALLYAKEIKTRFTVTRLAFAWGVHREIVDELMEEY